MDVAEDIWESEEAWRASLYSRVYIDYLKATLSPWQEAAGDVTQARNALWRTRIVERILSHQNPDGFWPLGGPPWFRVYPLPLRVLLDYGMHDRAAARRGVEVLYSTLTRETFPWPRHEPHDPKEYYVAYNARCLQTMAKAGLGSDARIQAAAQSLLTRQQWDGGWSVKPAWMYTAGEQEVDPRPSCWLCTLEVMRALGRLIAIPAPHRDRLLQFWRLNLNTAGLQVFGADWRDVGVLLGCLEFCADQGLRRGHADVDSFIAQLAALRGPDGRYPVFSDYYEVVAGHLLWRVPA